MKGTTMNPYTKVIGILAALAAGRRPAPRSAGGDHPLTVIWATGDVAARAGAG
jgi:hypothetical protein